MTANNEVNETEEDMMKRFIEDAATSEYLVRICGSAFADQNYGAVGMTLQQLVAHFLHQGINVEDREVFWSGFRTVVDQTVAEMEKTEPSPTGQPTGMKSDKFSLN